MTNFRFPPLKRWLLFIAITVICLCLASGVIMVIQWKGINPGRMRLATLTQSVMGFLLPALLTALLVTIKPWKFLKVTRVKVTQWLTGILTLLVAIPFMNAVSEWNASITLPDWLSSWQQWMVESEQAAQQTVEMVLGGTTVAELILGIVLVGIIPGISEEFFFRGTLQGMLGQTTRPRPHMAIWVAAFIFSAFHMQFLGFFPRLLLGAYFGYVVFWTGSIWTAVIIHAFNNSVIVIGDWVTRNYVPQVDINEGGNTSWVAIIISMLLTALGLLAIYRISHRSAAVADE